MCHSFIIDEQVIMRQTGHRSNAVRAYKRPGVEHDLMVSNILQPPSPKKPLIDENDENKDSNTSDNSTGKGKNIAITLNFTF